MQVKLIRRYFTLFLVLNATTGLVLQCRDAKAKASKPSMSKNNTSSFSGHKLIHGIAEKE